MKIYRYMAVTAVALLALGKSASADEIMVSAAASLTNAFKEIAADYEKTYKDTKVVSSFAASDVLLRQIINGAPVDIFASADQKAMDAAIEAGAVEADTRKDFARNEVVLIVPVQDEHGIGSVADLTKAGVTRVAYGNPDVVPAGRYTQSALEKSGYWESVQSKQVLGQNVRQVLDYVSRGEVDAGFVFATDAAILPERVKVVERLASPVPVLYPIALVKRDNRNARAGELLDYILSDSGQEVLAKYGFAAP